MSYEDVSEQVNQLWEKKRRDHIFYKKLNHVQKSEAQTYCLYLFFVMNRMVLYSDHS